MRKGRGERFWVDQGRAELVEAQRPHGAYFVDRVLKLVFLALFFGLFVVGLFVDENSGALLIAIGTGLALVMVVGWLNDRRNAIELRLKRLSADGGDWVEIRTRIEDDGGE
jgi:hypothetical protein